MNPLLLTPAEAGPLLRKSARRMVELARAGDIPCVRLGRNYYFNAEALKAWAERLPERPAVTPRPRHLLKTIPQVPDEMRRKPGRARKSRLPSIVGR